MSRAQRRRGISHTPHRRVRRRAKRRLLNRSTVTLDQLIRDTLVRVRPVIAEVFQRDLDRYERYKAAILNARFD